MQGRGDLPDLQIKVPLAPLQQDYYNGYFAYQKKGRNKWTGPLYKLRLVSENGDTGDLPFESVRVKAHNMMLNPLTEAVKTIGFIYCPEEKLTRVRVPIKYINEEKCPGMREGGYLNRLQQNIDINVEPFVRPPKFVVQDVGGMQIRDKRTISDLQFEGKGDGCYTVLADDTLVTMISKI